MRATSLEQAAISFVTALFAGEASGHDQHHTLRVYRTALRLAESEGGNREIVALSALLHDVDDPKLFHTENLANARGFLSGQGAAADLTDRVCANIAALSFRSGATPESLEGKLVQDADRLDAMGAVGVARCFAFGGSRGRTIYDPDRPPRLHMTAGEYAANDACSLNHFYEKLLLLRDRMNTEAGRRLAESRHAFLEAFLEEFYAEWDGRR